MKEYKDLQVQSLIKAVLKGSDEITALLDIAIHGNIFLVILKHIYPHYIAHYAVVRYDAGALFLNYNSQ